MTIPFGRRRLIVTFVPAPVRSRPGDDGAALGATDAELATLARNQTVDLDRPQWEGLRLLYGGTRRP